MENTKIRLLIPPESVDKKNCILHLKPIIFVCVKYINNTQHIIIMIRFQNTEIILEDHEYLIDADQGQDHYVIFHNGVQINDVIGIIRTVLE
jgi:hypothetical protein